MSQISFFSSRAARAFALILLFGAALTIRIYDLSDLPLDFHPTRQLVSFIKARGMYYQTKPDGVSAQDVKTAVRFAKLKADVEPTVFESLVAFTYRFTGEQVWVARMYASLFWLAGGIFLFLLAREWASFDGALVSTAYYLMFPYAILGSRSFQPDPLMVLLVLAFWWAFARWIILTPVPLSLQGRGGGVRVAVLAGVLGGLAIFIKFSAAFFVIGGALGLALSRFRLREMLRNAQVWVIALLGALPALLYLVYGIFIRGDLASQFSGRFVPALLFNPFNYLQWEVKMSMAAGGLFVMLGLLGLFLTRDRPLRIFLYGLWSSYIVFGLFFNYHIATHDYYHLPFIPIVGLSLAPLGEEFFARLRESAVRPWVRIAIYVILIFGLFSVTWDVRNQMKAVDYRPQAVMWVEIGERLDDDARVVALTQDYGSRLEYWGWRESLHWPYLGDAGYANVRSGRMTFDELFGRFSSKMSHFLVTDFEELDRQPELKEHLFSFYPVSAEGEGYLIFDLKNPLRQDSIGS
jgi:hypothetical protein